MSANDETMSNASDQEAAPTLKRVTDKADISVVVHTLNEAERIGYCLRSVAGWCGEIVLVDMHSDDSTCDIAARYGARIIQFDRVGFVEPARAFAVEQTRSQWILILDADELVPRRLAAELMAIAASGSADAVYLPRRNLMFGAVIKHSGWGAFHDRQLRFFRKGSVSFSTRIHQPPTTAPGARVLHLKDAEDCHLLHFNYVDVHHFIEKLNRYTDIEAREAFARNETASLVRGLKTAAQEWYARYLRSGGFLDGWRGFYLAFCMSFYRLATSAKLAELRDVGNRDRILRRYAEIAERLLTEYGPDRQFPIA